MNNPSKPMKDIEDNKSLDKVDVEASKKENIPPKSPLSFLSGSLTGIILSLVCYRLSQSMIIYFSTHSSSFNSPMAKSIASGFKTLIIGTSFLATFSFGFIGLGLSLVFFRSLFDAKNKNNNNN